MGVDVGVGTAVAGVVGISGSADLGLRVGRSVVGIDVGIAVFVGSAEGITVGKLACRAMFSLGTAVTGRGDGRTMIVGKGVVAIDEQAASTRNTINELTLYNRVLIQQIPSLIVPVSGAAIDVITIKGMAGLSCDFIDTRFLARFQTK
jgi:hypothetical protein